MSLGAVIVEQFIDRLSFETFKDLEKSPYFIYGIVGVLATLLLLYLCYAFVSRVVSFVFSKLLQTAIVIACGLIVKATVDVLYAHEVVEPLVFLYKIKFATLVDTFTQYLNQTHPHVFASAESGSN
jgi:hypothetical protein